jgi:hypothetical protein
MTQPDKRWNLFARELEDILLAHGKHLGDLDDQTEDIHREKVRRLQRSLLKPKSFPVLNPEEIELIVEKFGLSEEERVRLRAAILATAIERVLMDRIDPDDALLASEQIATILRDSLLAQFGRDSVMDTIRGDSSSIEDTKGERSVKRVQQALDDATMLENLSYGMESLSPKLLNGSNGCLTDATTELDSLDPDWSSSEKVKRLREDVDARRASVRKRLEE